MNAFSEYCVKARILGRVQGVWYRAWTEKQATARHLRGWVRNRSDGSVEAVFAGERAQVEAMIDACRQGPAEARVLDIEFRVIEYSHSGFKVLPTN